MKNRMIKIVIMAFLFVGLLIGCNQKEKNIVGRYVLTRIEKDNTTILEDEIKNSDVTGFIIFHEDGTGVFTMLNERLQFTWENGNVTGGNQTIRYELDGDELTLIVSATEKIYLQKEK